MQIVLGASCITKIGVLLFNRKGAETQRQRKDYSETPISEVISLLSPIPVTML